MIINESKNNLRSKTGITLIALVITIIVLLILAGVSISLVVGNNGVLTQASNSVVKNREASAKEEVVLAVSSCESDYWTDWAKNSSVDINTYFSKQRLQGYVTGTIDNVTEPGTDGSFTINYTKDGVSYTFNVDANRNVTLPNSGTVASTSGTGNTTGGNGNTDTSTNTSTNTATETTSNTVDNNTTGGGSTTTIAMTFATSGDKDSDGVVDEWEEVAFGNEKFYVVKKDTSTTPATLTLLAKYNLATTKDTTTNKWRQLTAAGGNCAFSNSNYWYTQGHWTAGTKTDLNNYETTYNETMPATETELNNAILRARAYAEQYGATGRLLSWAEVKSGQTDYLFTNHTSVLSDCNFWLGSSYENDSSDVCAVNSGGVGVSDFDNTGYFGVRPVLIISDSLSQ